MMDTFGNHLAPYVYLCKLELVTPFHHEPSGNLDVGAPIVVAPGGQDKCRVCVIRYVSKNYVTCLWDPKESAENLNIAI